jgi:hypothetical protein
VSKIGKLEKKMEKNGKFFVFPLTVYPKRTPSLRLADPSFGKPWVGHPILPNTQVLTQGPTLIYHRPR